MKIAESCEFTGFSIHQNQKVKALDDGEERGPVNHWRNTSGQRLYSSKRVEYAEQLIRDSVDGIYFHKNANFLNLQFRPCTPAIFIFDYRIILEAIDPGLTRQLQSERLSHPMWGRQQGSQEREFELIHIALIKIVEYAESSKSVSSEKDFFKYLDSHSQNAATDLGSPWPDVVLRGTALRYNVSRGKGKTAAKKILKILSLIHSGIVSCKHLNSSRLNIINLLSASPVIRVDHKIKESSAKSNIQKNI